MEDKKSSWTFYGDKEELNLLKNIYQKIKQIQNYSVGKIHIAINKNQIVVVSDMRNEEKIKREV